VSCAENYKNNENVKTLHSSNNEVENSLSQYPRDVCNTSEENYNPAW
jgi:hypothetical protein